MNSGRWAPTARDALTIGGALLVSLAAGLAVNATRSHRLPLLYREKPAVVEATDLDLAGFEALVAEKGGIVLDARPELFHRVGHVPGALSLPREDFDSAFARLQPRLEPFRSRTIAIYCADESCDDSRQVQSRLMDMGFKRVAVFPGGWEAWTAAGLPKEGVSP